MPKLKCKTPATAAATEHERHGLSCAAPGLARSRLANGKVMMAYLIPLSISMSLHLHSHTRIVRASARRRAQ